MNPNINISLEKTAIPELATELEKRFDSDAKLAILSRVKNIEQDSVEFVIRHTILGEESPGYRVYYEHLYSLVHKNNSWDMTLLELKSVTI
jgi:hypothetical protein